MPDVKVHDGQTIPTESFLANKRVRERSKYLAREDRHLKTELVRLRRDRGLTQQDVADILGVSQQAVHKLERYDSDPKMSTLARYANAIGALVTHDVEFDAGQTLETTRAPSTSSNSPNTNVIQLDSFRARKRTIAGGSWSEPKPVDTLTSRYN